MTTPVLARVRDPVREGVASGWKVIDASKPGQDLVLECDVAIVGTGAGGGMVAAALAQAGLSVVMIEEGGLRTSSDFTLREADAYPDLYQESAARKTADKAINILQGRCVGGGTTVNWTSSFRTPAATLDHWVRIHGLSTFTASALAPWFDAVEKRLSITPWEVAPNPNNDALARGAARLRIPAATIRRNVRGCADLGYCGVGCVLNAKQSMLVTTIPDALARGATLVTRARAERLVIRGDTVVALEGRGMDASGASPGSRSLTIRAQGFLSAAGAIGTPGLLLRSRVPDPHGLVGRRTFVHPTLVSAAIMPDRIDGFAGAPQTVFSDHYLDTVPPSGPMGFKLEAAPIHPILASITLPGHGAPHAAFMREFPHLHVLVALLRDGFHPDSTGGTVRLREDGTPLLDYPFTPYVWDGARRAFRAMADLQFAAGAKRVMPIHGRGEAYDDSIQARRAIDAFKLAPLATPVVSAHVMGGCAIGPDPRRACVTPEGRYHHLANLHVADGSLFPTSVGSNPQLTIYAVAARIGAGLAAQLAPRKPGG